MIIYELLDILQIELLSKPPLMLLLIVSRAQLASPPGIKVFINMPSQLQ